MGKNIEIKAYCRNLLKFKTKLKQLPTTFEGDDVQMDTFFKVPKGRLKLRESKLYGNILIPYIRLDQSGPKQADYGLIKIDDVIKIKNLFTEMFGIIGVVNKKREIYLYENVRIHLDDVETLGTYIEFEAVVQNSNAIDTNRKKVEWLLGFFGIDQKDLIEDAYMDLLVRRNVT